MRLRARQVGAVLLLVGLLVALLLAGGCSLLRDTPDDPTSAAEEATATAQAVAVATSAAATAVAEENASTATPDSEAATRETPSPNGETATGEEPDPPETAMQRERLIETYLDQLDEGLILFNPPTEMTAGQTYVIQARITRELTDTAVLTSTAPAATEFTGGLVETAQPRVEPVQVGTYMRVRLSGENFRIEPLSEERQVVGRRDFTEWAWNVTPTWHGEHPLLLAVTVHVEVAGTEEVRTLPVKTEIIRVNVDPVYTTAEIGRAYWQIILGLVGLAIVIPLVLRRRGRRRAAPIDDADTTRESLERQLANARENLRLIRERKSAYVLDTDIPLDLIKNERALEAEIVALEAALTHAE